MNIANIKIANNDRYSIVRFLTITLEKMAEMIDGFELIEMIDGGDHQVNVWSDNDNTIVSAQGTGNLVTVLELKKIV